VNAATICDGKLVIAQHPDPRPGRGQVLVRVRAAGVNNADLMQVAGVYPAPPDSPPDIPGMELAGEVVDVGEGVSRWRPGDRVMALVGGGAQAELALVDERVALPVPDALPWEEAGAFPEAFTTAHDALFTQCGLALGERALVHGAAGGVGTAAVQLAAATGARVTATVRHPQLHEGVATLGASTVVAPDDWAHRGPFDVVLELVGGPNLAPDLSALAVGGRVCVIGVGAGARADVDLLTLMMKRARISGSTLRARPPEDKAIATRLVEAHVLPLLEAGRLRVPIAATFPLTQAEAAYERFAAGAKLGKIVLVVEDD
jgi:putative PIG3 family NAD(P)H quinone oxidoreductase